MPCACAGAFVLFIAQHLKVTGIRLSPVGSGGRDHARAQRGDAGSLGGGGHGHAQSGVRGRARGGGAAPRGASTATSRPTTGANGCLPRGPTTGNGAARPVRAASPAAAAPFSASVATAMSDDIDDADAATIAALTAAEAACGNAADSSADAAAATAAPTAPSGARPVRAAGVVAAAVLAAGAAADGDRGAAARGKPYQCGNLGKLASKTTALKVASCAVLAVIKTIHDAKKVEQFRAPLPYLAWISLP